MIKKGLPSSPFSSLEMKAIILAYRTKSVCKNPYNTRYLLVL